VKAGFLLEFIPYLSIRPDHGIRGRNDKKIAFSDFL